MLELSVWPKRNVALPIHCSLPAQIPARKLLGVDSTHFATSLAGSLPSQAFVCMSSVVYSGLVSLLAALREKKMKSANVKSVPAHGWRIGLAN